MEEIHRYLDHEIRETNFDRVKAPFIGSSYTKWREDLWKAYSADPLTFTHVVDTEMLPKFLKKVSERYYSDYIRSNIDLDLEQEAISTTEYKVEISELAAILARWSTEIELAVDIIERSKLYNLYQIPEGLQNIYSELQAEWGKKSDPFKNKVYRFFLKVLSYGAGKLSESVKHSIVGVVSANLAHSKAQILSGIIYAYFCGAFPWPILALLGTQLSWMLSAWMVTRIGNRISNKLSSAQILYHINELKGHFEMMLSDLMQRNEESRNLIANCFIAQSVSDKEKAQMELGEHLNQVLLHKTEAGSIFQQEFDEDQYIADSATFEEDGDWVKIEIPQYEIQQSDEWITIEKSE